MKLFNSTKKWKQWWETRKINWQESYLSTWNHPHRYLISGILKELGWMSLFEIGCGAGANLVNIVKSFPGKTLQLGGSDINPDAIQVATGILKGAVLKVGSGDDVILSDDSVDIVLTDRMLIYVGPGKIDSYIKEIRRIARNYIILCEFHSPSLYDRIKIKISSGYNAYNYKTLLDKYGFYDIMAYKIPPEAWPGDTYPSYLIVAKVPKRKWN